MKVRDTLIISLAIIAAGYLVADSLKPVQAYGEGEYRIVADGRMSAAWVLNKSTGKVQFCFSGYCKELGYK